MTTSLLEALNTDRTVADKARFVDYFVGDSVKSWWTERDLNGSGTVSMKDEIDGGLNILTGAVSQGQTALDFNNIRPFTHNASIIQGTVKNLSDNMHFGLANEATDRIDIDNQDMAVLSFEGADYFKLRTGDGTTGETATSSVINQNTQWNDVRIELSSGDAKMYLNNSLSITTTATLPTLRTQPRFLVSGNAVNSQIRYCEAWNT